MIDLRGTAVIHSALSNCTFANLQTMYPLRFQPLFRRYLWGGRRLATILQKTIGAEMAAESWEIVDHQDDQSVVAHGPLAGQTLRQLLADSGAALLGAKVWRSITSPDIPPHLHGRFPLLFKFLDANQALSVQVHPDDRFGELLSPPDLGKTEAWYVMHAEPGAKIFAGLKSGMTKSNFAAAVESNATESALHWFEPRVGDCVFIPAGTIHALGAGLVIAEIQQASNTTFRVYDWGRVEATGQPRPLHIESAMAVTDFSRGPVQPQRVLSQQAGHATLVSCDKFVLNRLSLDAPLLIAGDEKFHLLAVTRGEVRIEFDPSDQPLKFGETALLPASLPALRLTPGTEGAELLEIHLPELY